MHALSRTTHRTQLWPRVRALAVCTTHWQGVPELASLAESAVSVWHTGRLHWRKLAVQSLAGVSVALAWSNCVLSPGVCAQRNGRMLGGTGRICAQDARAFRAAWSVYSCVLALTLMGIGSVISVASSDTCKPVIRLAASFASPLLLWPCIAGLSGANPSMGLREPTGVDAAEEALEPL